MTRWWPFFRKQREQDLSEELQAHLAMAIQERIEQGESAQDAETAARKEFGNRLRVAEDTRETWGWIWLDELRQDVTYALRMMRRSPAFTAIAVLSIAMGIGANTAIFSLVHTVILRTLPVPEPGQLVEFLSQYPGEPRVNGFPWPVYQHIRQNNQVFSGVLGVSAPWESRLSLSNKEQSPESVKGESVTGNFFSVLGVQAALGHLSPPDGDSFGSPTATGVVLSWQLWKARFQGEPTVLGRQVKLDDTPVTIVGVAPHGFSGLQAGAAPDLWMPATGDGQLQRPGNPRDGRMGLGLVARLKPGVSVEQARAEMQIINRWRIAEMAKTSKDPQVQRFQLHVEPAAQGLSRIRDRFAKPLLILMAIVALLLLLACANIAGLLTARGAARNREMALRVSLGAGRARLIRQALTEALLLAMAGALVGLAFAYVGTAALIAIIGSGRDPVALVVKPNGAVLLFTAATALLTGLLFGLVPSLRAFAAVPATSLRESNKAGETRIGRLAGQSLVAAQVAISLLLLSSAILFIHQLSSLRNLDLGFQRESILLVSLDPGRLNAEQREQLVQPFQELLSRLRQLPGVRSASLAGATPISGAGASRLATLEGIQEEPSSRRYFALNWVAPGYFETLGTPLLAGRDFTAADGNRSRVALINQAIARQYFPNGDAVGRRLTFDGDTRPYEIIGIVANAKYGELREPAPRTIYLPAFEQGRLFSQFVLRTNIPPRTLEPLVRQTAREVVSSVPIRKVTTLAEQIDASIVPERLIATLSGFFGILGLVLAAIGLYGLLSFLVTRRTNEIGIRLALGATRPQVVGLILRDALLIVAAGLAAAVPLALWGRRFAASLIDKVPVEPNLSIAWAMAVMLAVALLAAYLPARRASRLDPMEALRHD